MAAIDAGTNTFRLLIADRQKGIRQPLCKEQSIPRLGRDYIPEQGLAPISMERALMVMKRFAALMESYQPERMRAVATSVVREAKNSRQFVDRVAAETGIVLEIISGRQEAMLTAGGVLHALPVAGQPLLIFDIGGGSTEFTLVAADGRVQCATSFPFGVVKLTEQFLAEPVQKDLAQQQVAKEVDRCLEAVVEALRDSGNLPLPPATILTGTAGTMTSLAAIDQQLEKYRPELINGYQMSFARLQVLNDNLWQLDAPQRRRVPGLEAGRADVILAGGIIALRVMDRLGFDRVMISDDGLLEGVALSLFNH
ncbi:MAG: Ppx/GppA family phosphatase [Deltaproteobacteria bacterium]|nr:Ppx/GppA family phosphatase [Candidatus Anaeroferrophillus wilburensis]MBN2889342.1 Ppx/GppA family phosphatase [Deltaproteobacteria bacterium]